MKLTIAILVFGILGFFGGFPLTLMMGKPLTKYIISDVLTTFFSGILVGYATHKIALYTER